MRNIHLLGATGSIGVQVLEIIASKPNLNLKTISVGKNIDLAKRIIKEFQPDYVSVLKQSDCDQLRCEFPHIAIGYGKESLIIAATLPDTNAVVVNAVVGMVGLEPTLAAIEAGYDILLANKETLVAGGALVMDAALKKGVSIIPIDSEHSAIFQCLQGHRIEDVNEIMITASGGSFRDYSREALRHVTLKEALKHPNWSMGAKITIDSATMVNKGLEVIEAHFLFGLPYENIKTVLHKESIIHAMVSFIDGSVLAQLSYPDMRLPIQIALTYPHKEKSIYAKPLQWHHIKALHFDDVDKVRYPCLQMAYDVGKLGGIMPAVYNASNEAAVALFIEGKISFLDIEAIIAEAIEDTKNISTPSLQDIIDATTKVRENILSKYN